MSMSPHDAMFGDNYPAESARHPSESTTQRYMHLSPAATEDAIRLLNGRQSGVELAQGSGDILDTRVGGKR